MFQNIKNQELLMRKIVTHTSSKSMNYNRIKENDKIRSN